MRRKLQIYDGNLMNYHFLYKLAGTGSVHESELWLYVNDFGIADS